MFGSAKPKFWLDYADNSYVATRLLWFTGFMFEAAVNGHRTLELYLKAVLVSHGIEVKPGSPAWGHRLEGLGEAAASINPAFRHDDFQRRLRFFERYFAHVRYPSDSGPSNGSLIWFSFDANILPLDESVAFARPRILLSESEWQESVISRLLREENVQPHQRRALAEANRHIAMINCIATGESEIRFNSAFTYDLPGC